MNAVETKQVWVYLRSIWPKYVVPETSLSIQIGVQAWYDVLGDLSLTEVQAAIVLLAAREFPPPLGLIRTTVLERRSTLNGDQLIPPDLDEALSEVMAQMRQVGYLGKPEWSHPAIGAAVEALGGWVKCCESSWDTSMRAQFRDMFASAAKRWQRESGVPAPALVSLAGRATQMELTHG